ncbi:MULTISPECIES: MerR family transcriptional regulator [Thermomonospora]|uniref:Transcriptional regulator, MerR family n=1 Tax=Thermomonospora curvata (strain ATCC 19995 / DSM 43183 / JCM 3096 / KCTC 9072 / NBRC 15933 / NCIMB 10081 / Henssen B9) TaxID=471852 RepID=D1A1B4_THECD|nr:MULTISPECIES: MerR family transcriptional regulator [Thermomonospora]ACY95836.1 transcriptional regulator, MerR family [Thermomonospora curvata DSM 43183]PKK16088.1 MAG: MerR family transcriptional regulator [Thermomonospora sp. CIF 1]
MAQPRRPEREYRIEELAKEAGIPVRTLRYYQERRLLPPPRRQGRVAYYSQAHLDRLRLIAELLERGYRLDGIEELLAAWEQGRDVGELLGFEWAAAAPWSRQPEIEMTMAELTEMFGDQLTPDVLAEAEELGYIKVDGDRVTHRIPRLLEATAALVQEGIPLSAILAVSWELEAAFDRMAYAFVRLARRHLLDPLGDNPTPADLARLARTVERLRPVARTVADEHFARAMDRRIRKELPQLNARLSPPDH